MRSHNLRTSLDSLRIPFLRERNASVVAMNRPTCGMRLRTRSSIWRKVSAPNNAGRTLDLALLYTVGSAVFTSFQFLECINLRMAVGVLAKPGGKRLVVPIAAADIALGPVVAVMPSNDTGPLTMMSVAFITSTITLLSVSEVTPNSFLITVVNSFQTENGAAL